MNRVRYPSLLSRRFIFAVLGLLVLGQLALIHHSLDLDEHAGGESCEICLLSGAHDHGLVAQADSPDVSTVSEAVFAGRVSSVTCIFHTFFLARAPPRKFQLV